MNRLAAAASSSTTTIATVLRRPRRRPVVTATWIRAVTSVRTRHRLLAPWMTTTTTSSRPGPVYHMRSLGSSAPVSGDYDDDNSNNEGDEDDKLSASDDNDDGHQYDGGNDDDVNDENDNDDNKEPFTLEPDWYDHYPNKVLQSMSMSELKRLGAAAGVDCDTTVRKTLDKRVRRARREATPRHHQWLSTDAERDMFRRYTDDDMRAMCRERNIPVKGLKKHHLPRRLIEAREGRRGEGTTDFEERLLEHYDTPAARLLCDAVGVQRKRKKGKQKTRKIVLLRRLEELRREQLAIVRRPQHAAILPERFRPGGDMHHYAQTSRTDGDGGDGDDDMEVSDVAEWERQVRLLTKEELLNMLQALGKPLPGGKKAMLIGIIHKSKSKKRRPRRHTVESNDPPSEDDDDEVEDE